MMILVAGPYRSGTGGDPAKIEANVQAMTQTAWALYQRGYLPVLGEWLALPLLEAAGSKAPGDAVYEALFHPSAERLLAHCDGVLRIGGPSKGADRMVKTARSLGKAVFTALDQLPAVE